MVRGRGRIASKIKHGKDLGKATGDKCGISQRTIRFVRLSVPEVQGHRSFKKVREGALPELHFKASTSQRIHLAPCSPSTGGETEAREGGREVDRKRGSRWPGWSGEGERNCPNCGVTRNKVLSQATLGGNTAAVPQGKARGRRHPIQSSLTGVLTPQRQQSCSSKK